MGVPTATWAIDVPGRTITATWNESVLDNGNSATLTARGVVWTCTSLTLGGSGLTTQWRIPIGIPFALTTTVSLATGSVASLSTSQDNATITAAAVTNGSRWRPGGNPRARRRTRA